MTRADKWKKRDCVLRYFAFKEECQSKGVKFENGQSITFILPFPKSYSDKKKRELDGQPHTLKPDTDNLLKSLLDALYQNDAHIWHIAEIKKLWGYQGKIIIK